MALVFLRRFVPRIPARLGLGFKNYTRARAMRLAFEDMGPAYVKFGQMIASSPTAFPEPVTREFAKCLDEVRVIAPARVRKTLAKCLGRPIDEVFTSFDETPLASASIAQVHRAVLKSGKSVVVKVQRPGIERAIRQDLGLMRAVARFAEWRHPDLKRANLVGIVDDFRRTMASEMDFREEAQNIRDFRALLEAESLTAFATAPEVEDDLCHREVLVMEELHGCRIDDKAGVDQRAESALDLMRHTSRVFWTSVFMGGFFHGDVHAGNIMVLDDGRLGYLDFGIFGRFTMDDRAALCEWMSAMVTGDGNKLANALKQMGAVPDEVDWPRFVEDVDQIFMPLRSLTVDQPEMIEAFFPRLRAMAADYNMRLPQNFVLILKQLSYFGRYVLLHAPQFNENLDPETQKVFAVLFVRFHGMRRSGAEQTTASPTSLTA